MAKAVYVGVGSKARKMKKAYVGISGKARKVKKMYNTTTQLYRQKIK